MDGSNFYHGGGKELRPHLKCTYGNGPLDEYLVGFTTTERRIEEIPFFMIQDGKPIIKPNGFENHMFVKRDEVIALEDNNGLVKLFGFKEIENGNCLISIRDSAEKSILQRKVPSTEIVWM